MSKRIVEMIVKFTYAVDDSWYSPMRDSENICKTESEYVNDNPEEIARELTSIGDVKAEVMNCVIKE